MRCVCRKLSDKEVATELNIADETVHVHLRNAFKKLGVQRRKAAIVKFLGTFTGGGGKSGWRDEKATTPFLTLLQSCRLTERVV